MGDFKNPEEALGFLQYLMEEMRLSEKSVNTYRDFYIHFDSSKLSQDYIRSFILEHGNSPPVRAMVKNFLAFKKLSGYELPRRTAGSKPKKLIRKITEEEIKKVSDLLYRLSFQKGLIFDLIVEGALRRSEVTTIKLNSFRWEEWLENTSRFCKLLIKGKGNKERIVLVNPETAEMIVNHFIKEIEIDEMDEIKEILKSDTPLFQCDNEVNFSHKIYDTIKRTSKRVLGRDIRPHELRHYRATDLEKRGVNIRDIKNYLGHSRIATTEIYLHKSGEESVEAIEDILSL